MKQVNCVAYRDQMSGTLSGYVCGLPICALLPWIARIVPRGHRHWCLCKCRCNSGYILLVGPFRELPCAFLCTFQSVNFAEVFSVTAMRPCNAECFLNSFVRLLVGYCCGMCEMRSIWYQFHVQERLVTSLVYLQCVLITCCRDIPAAWTPMSRTMMMTSQQTLSRIGSCLLEWIAMGTNKKSVY